MQPIPIEPYALALIALAPALVTGLLLYFWGKRDGKKERYLEYRSYKKAYEKEVANHHSTLVKLNNAEGKYKILLKLTKGKEVTSTIK